MTTAPAVKTQDNEPRIEDTAAEAAERKAESARERAQVALHAARESVGQGIDAAREKATAIGTGIKGKATVAKRQAEKLKEGAVERYQGARKKTVKLANDGETWVKDHPTRSMFGALAVGTAAGFLASTLLRRRRRRSADAA